MIEIVPYSPWWPARFAYIKSNLTHDLTAPLSSDTGPLPPASFLRIEHVGSTSIPGCWAKPNIDILIVITDPSHFEPIHQRLIWGDREGGYRYIGDGGVAGRWSLKLDDVRPARHLYVVLEGSLLLKAHIGLREVLRGDDELRDEYSAVKRGLCKAEYEQCYEYPEAKDGVIGKILRRAGWTEEMILEKQGLRIRRDRVQRDWL
jgi:GrpB-like predicted nucleotidyltransferase (UPF0157 family)